MQAIEFDTHIENGLIHLPANLQHWQEGKPVRVIVLVDEKLPENKNQQHKPSINRHAGKINLTQDPLAFQNVIRDEWA
jgi:hypothetical protein